MPVSFEFVSELSSITQLEAVIHLAHYDQLFSLDLDHFAVYKI